MSVIASPVRVGLVADDLTGAADAAAGFAEAGWRSEIVLRPDKLRDDEPDDDRPVLWAVDAASRHATDEQARAQTAAAVTELMDAGAERLFLKIDSTARGSVAAQIEGALAAWSRPDDPATAVVCPAFPVHRRTVSAGELRVNGIAVHLSDAGADPVAPVAHSRLSTLIPGGVTGPVSEIGRTRTLLLDAESDVDLERIARVTATAAASVIAVGSGGLATALAARWRVRHARAPRDGSHASPSDPGSGVLFAVSSLHPVSLAQVERVRDDLRPHDALLLSADGLFADPEDAAGSLARAVAAAVRERPYRAIVLVGGDGAAAVLARLGAHRVMIGAQILRGCPDGVIVGGCADGTTVVTKSGGFGGPDTLATLLDLLRPASGPGS